VTVRDEDIRTAGLMHPRDFGPRANIKSSIEFTEWEAAHEAGCDLWRWHCNEYPTTFKARVMAWYELHNLVQLHQHDAGLTKRGRRKSG